jgi:acyl-CoA reductase-like NAD-dependent aldehyde dehydrogenase
MASPLFPALIPNWIDGHECPEGNHETFIKHSPANGLAIATVARSRIGDINQAVESAAAAFSGWATLTPGETG